MSCVAGQVARILQTRESTAMTAHPVTPFNQKIRIATLRVVALAFFPLALLVNPVLSSQPMGEVLEVAGIGLIFAGVVGRFWSILYIGGHKNALVMDQGPYSMCRHPLYFFSTLAVHGFGLMVQSLVFAVVMAAFVFAVLSLTAAREEKFLHDHFGTGYARYAAKTPRILPDPRLFRTGPEINVNVSSLRRNFFDALVFVALIPVAESIEEMRDVIGLFSFGLY